eukprot:m.289318 g.289318  ORF g.289318 m.289318 type:complete len:139 (+) comp55063_c0_seq12:663-1079(+)
MSRLAVRSFIYFLDPIRFIQTLSSSSLTSNSTVKAFPQKVISPGVVSTPASTPAVGAKTSTPTRSAPLAPDLPDDMEQLTIELIKDQHGLGFAAVGFEMSSTDNCFPPTLFCLCLCLLIFPLCFSLPLSLSLRNHRLC